MINLFDHFHISEFDTQQGEALFELIDSNRLRLETYFAGTVSQTKTLANTLQYCQTIEQRRKNRTYFPFIISDKTGDAERFIGLIDVKNIDWNIPKAEIGYFIDANYEGQGIISNALSSVLDHLEQTFRFKKLLCRASGDNLGSINVALKNGFELEGIIRKDYKTTNNEIVDLHYYGKVYE